MTVVGRKRRRCGRGSGTPTGLGLAHMRGALSVLLLSALAAVTVTSADASNDQQETSTSSNANNNGPLSSASSTPSQHDVGKALNLPIGEATETPLSGKDNANGEETDSQLLVPHLLHLTEQNFVATFQDMFRDDENNNDDAILCLFAIYSPDCQPCEPMLRGLNDLSSRLDEQYDEMIAPRWGGANAARRDSSSDAPPRPVLGMLNGSNVTHGFYTKLEPLAVYPTLKFALVQRQRMVDDDTHASTTGDDEGPVGASPEVAIQIFDYIGPSARTMDDVDGMVESIWHYWYRYIGARRTNLANANGSRSIASTSSPVFVVPSALSALSFLKKHGDHILKPVPSHIPVHLNEEERQYFSDLLEPTLEEEEAGLGDPVTVFVQCRPQDDGTLADEETPKKLYSKFDGLAEEFVNRRDVTFVALQPPTAHGCKERYGGFGAAATEQRNDDAPDAPILDGFVAVIRTTDVSTIQEDKPLAVYVPPTAESGAKDTMTRFIISHTSPTLLLFDRNFAADYAFPFYRTLHAVLFIDTPELASPINTVGNEKRLRRNREITEKSRRAIHLFREAAINHRRSRPEDDVVFLVVPSYEKKVLNLFGIDLWTGLDRKFAAARGIDLSASEATAGASPTTSTGDADSVQSCEAEEVVVPTVMLTSRSSPTNRSERVVTKRYYLSSGDILYGSSGGRDEEATTAADDAEPNVISRFIGNYFAGGLQPAIQSQPTPTNRTNDDGVQLLTGNTFKPLVVDQKNRHALINFFSATCGHCKRFNVIWNQLGRLVRALNWQEMVDVMKMDLTRNELPLDNLSVWEYPSVYYFPANEKENAIPMNVEGDNTYGDLDLRGYDLVEWLLNQDKFDEQELEEMYRTGSSGGSGGGGEGVEEDVPVEGKEEIIPPRE